jgi:hypothetical protein
MVLSGLADVRTAALFLLFSFLLFWSHSSAALTQTQSTTSCANIGSGRDWNNLGNTVSSDNNYTTVSLDDWDYSEYLECTGFNFSIPVSATINGILVRVERRASRQGRVRDDSVRLLKNGNRVGNNLANTSLFYPNSDTYVTYGSTSYLWATTWTPAEINDNDFGFSLRAYKDHPGNSWINTYIDHIEITVDYSAGVPATPTVNTLTTTNTTPTITGTFDSSDAAGGFVVTVDSVSYPLSGPHLSNSGDNWTLVIPTPLSPGVYDVSAEATNGSGGSSTDTTTDELTIIAVTDWDDYLYSEQLTVTTGPTAPDKRYNGYTVRLASFDTSTLISEGKMQSDCSDLRVVKDNGGSLVEVDRHLIDCNTTASDIRFMLQADIADSSTDTSYYLYYGNPSAGAPNPVTTTNVYRWYDDASTNRLASYTRGRIDAWHGTGWDNNMNWNASGYYSFSNGDNFTSGYRIAVDERDALIEAEFYHTGCFPNNMTSGVMLRGIIGSGSGGSESSDHYYATNRGHNSRCGGGYSDDGDIVKSSRTTTAVDGSDLPSIVENQWRKMALSAWGVNATNLNFWDSNTGWSALGWPDAGALHISGTDTSDYEGRGFAAIMLAQDQGRWRNMVVRRYVETEPVVTIPPSSCTLDAFTVTQPAYALACPQTPAQIQIEALCPDGSTKTDYAGSASLTSSPNTTPPQFFDTVTRDNVINSVTFDGSSGFATVYLYHNDEEAVTVTATDGAATGSGSATSFHAYGFVDSSPLSSLTSCTTSATHQLTAFGQLQGNSGCSVIEGFSGNKAVKIWSDYVTPSSGGSQVAINGNAIPTAEGATTNLNFVNGVANFNVYYPDAGEVKVNFKFDQDPYDGDPFSAMYYEDQFVVVPAGLSIYSDDASSGCASNNGSCSYFKKTGESFNLKIRAYCETGNPAGPKTLNFQYNNIALSHSLVAPGSGTGSCIGDDTCPGSIAVTSFSISDADNGEHLINNQTVSEVGIFTFSTPELDYLGISSAIAASTSVSIGRFAPDHYLVEVDNNGSFNPVCSSNFTYTGQSMSYLTTPSLLMTARNGSNTTMNYRDDFIKLHSSSVNIDAPTQDSANSLAVEVRDGIPTLITELSDGTISGNDNGTVTYTLSNADTYRYTKNAAAKVSPFTADLDLVTASVVDSDGISAQGSLPSLEPAGAEIRYGRLAVENAYGSELTALTGVTVSAEYFNGNSFTVNTADSCTSFDSTTDIDWSTPGTDYSGIASGDIESTGSGTLVYGSSSFSIHKTGSILEGPGTTGYADYTFNADSWLEFDWNGDGSETSPRPRASFGVYNRSKRLIYTREIY